MPRVPTSEFKASYHDHVRRDVVPFVPTTGGRLLDVGGGIGATAALLKAQGIVEKAGTADMVDPATALDTLDFAYQGNLDDEGFLKGIFREQGPFQLILALDVLEHLIDPWSTARVLADMLDTGGYLVASIPNVRHWRTSANLLLGGKWAYTEHGTLDRTHLRFFVRNTAVELVSGAGLTVQSVNSPSTGPRAALLDRLTFGRLRDLTAMQYVVVGRKV